MSLLGRIFGSGHNSHYRRGIVLFNQGRHEEAAVEFETALAGLSEHDPDWSLGRFYMAEARSRLGLSYLHQGAFERAEAEFTRAAQQNPDFPDLHFHLAVLAERRGDLALAAESVEQAIALNPEYADALACRALVRWRAGQNEAALSDLERARSLGFPLPQGVFPGALEEAVRAALHSTSESEGFLAEAVERYELGDRQEALTALEKAVEERPGFADLRCRLGTLLLEMGRHEEAVASLEEAVRINPNYVEALIQLGFGLMALGRTENAARAFRLAAQAEPDDPQIPLYEAEALFHAGRAEAARTIAVEAAQRAPRLARAQRLAGLCDLALGRPDTAGDWFERAASVGRGEGSQEQGEAGVVALALGEAETAASQWRRALRTNPADAEARLGLAFALSRMGNLEGARSELERALGGDPECFAARRELGSVLLRLGLPREATKMLRGAAGQYADDPHVHRLLGIAYRQLGREEDAASHLEAAVGFDRGAVEARVDLALVYLRMGRTEQAHALLDEALARDPLNPVARALRVGPHGDPAAATEQVAATA